VFGAVPSLVEGVGAWVIDNAPKPVKDFAVAVFGVRDKVALLVGIALVAIILGAAAGMLARRRFGAVVAVFAGFGAAGALAAARDQRVSVGAAAIAAAAAALLGLVVLRLLLRTGAPGSVEEGVGGSRRRFLFGAGALLGLAALSGAIGRNLIERAKRVAAGRADVVLPSPAQALPPAPAAAELGVEGLSPIVTPNSGFYRIDTAFAVPQVGLEDWALKVKGAVDRPYSLTFGDLLDLRLVERDVTLSCVSNEVGGGLVGNARWLGAPLSEILDRAGLQSGAEQVVGRSVDGFTAGFPVEAVFDGREALVAVGMNGEPLPVEHGFPARLVVSGLYGYVSATKWLSEIELTGWDDFDAYWIPRGWAKEAPIKTQSRIDTPRAGAAIEPGPTPVAGVAWAPSRGISKVEVQLGDDAPWVEAELSEALAVDSWVQWRVDWQAEPGRRRIRSRATDGDGATQPEEISPAAPDGATGWHTVSIEVSAA